MAKATAGSIHCPNCGGALTPGRTQCAYCRARLATIACPSCFQPVFAGSAFCSHCGDAVQRVEGPPAVRSCPRCRQVMREVTVGTLTLDECERCDGTWIAAAPFVRLCREREARVGFLNSDFARAENDDAAGDGRSGSGRARVWETKIRYWPCPACGTMMNRVNFSRVSGVVLDVCKAHGTYFDAGELHRVMRFIEDGGVDRAREKERNELEDERWRAKMLRDSPMTPTLGGSIPADTRTRWMLEGARAVDGASVIDVAEFIASLFRD